MNVYHSVYDSLFFELLNSTYRSIFSEAQQKLYTLVIPADGSFSLDDVDLKFIATHILKPSPHFLDHFLCCGSTASLQQQVEYDEKNAVLFTSTGNGRRRHAHILAVEIAHNEFLQPYQIFLTDKPLVHTFLEDPCRAVNCSLSRAIRGKASRMEDISLRETRNSPMEPPTFNEARSYLQSSPVFAQTLRVIEEKVENFIKNYIILEKFISDTVEKLKCISETAIEVLSSDAVSIDLKQATLCVDNYVSGLAHHKVFGRVKSFCRNLDVDIGSRLEFLRFSEASAALLGVHNEAFQCELPMSVVELASLDAKYSAQDKLWCLRRTVNSIQSEILTNAEKNGVLALREMPALTIDVLVKLIVVVMARSKSTYLASNIYYVDHFCGVKDDVSSFTISTFKAALELVKSFSGAKDGKHLSPFSLKKELSLIDFMTMTASMNEEQHTDSDDVDPVDSDLELTFARYANVDSKLEEATRLIEKQTLDFRFQEEEQLRKQEAYSSMPSSSNVSSSTDEEGSLLFSPLNSLRRSLRSSFRP